MKETKLGTFVRMTENGEETHNFNFATNLSTADKARFVNSVVDLVVDDENYNSVIKDLVFDFYTIKFFTDINTTELEQSDNFIDDVEEFLLETNIVEIVKANAFPTLFEELNNAVDLSVRYRTGIHPSPIVDSLASLLSTLEKKVKEVDLGNAMEMAQKFVGMTGELTPESIVNAYINSDLHQKNLEEIAESKKKNEIKIDENLGEAVRTVVEETKVENKTKGKSTKTKKETEKK